MLKQNNINDTFVEFFDQKIPNRNLILNYINDEVFIFYEYVINYYLEKFKFKIIKNYSENSSDLFETNPTINYFVKPKKKEIENILLSVNKNIIICDYQHFIQYSKTHLSINCYNYKKDLQFFLNNILNINDQNLINGLFENPKYIFSEISKYYTNYKNYQFNIVDPENHNFILNIRKNYYELKSKKSDFIRFYELIKSEHHYKKFNFLIY